jgi:hypothetical protein
MGEQYFAPFVCFQTWQWKILYHVAYLRSLHLKFKLPEVCGGHFQTAHGFDIYWKTRHTVGIPVLLRITAT